MDDTDIISIYYGTVTPLIDPVNQLGGYTAISVPYGTDGSRRVCFVRYKDIKTLGKTKMLLLHVYAGKRQMNMCQIVSHGDKWVNSANHGLIYVLPDVTMRLHTVIDKLSE